MESSHDDIRPIEMMTVMMMDGVVGVHDSKSFVHELNVHAEAKNCQAAEK
jgi:hypothetical protein